MNQRGTTLLELIVVWTIVGICALLVFPTVNTWMQRYRLKTAAQEMASTLRTAQLEAVTKNVVYRVCFDPERGSYLLQRSEGGLWIDEGGLHLLPRGVQMKEVNLPGGSAQFHPNATASSGSITLKDFRKDEKKIALTLVAGRVRIE